MSRATIERQVGTKTLAGTDWPVIDRVERRQYGRRVEWALVLGLCNGVPRSTSVYRTRSEALAAYHVETSRWSRRQMEEQMASTIETAIILSARENRTVAIEVDAGELDAVTDALLALADDSADEHGETSYWGTTESGSEWTVSVRVAS